MQAQAAEQTKIVYVRSAMVIFFQSDYGLVVLHVSRNDQSDATDRVILDPVDEKRHIRRHLANPVGVGALGNSPLQNVWLVDSFQESDEVTPVRYQ